MQCLSCGVELKNGIGTCESCRAERAKNRPQVVFDRKSRASGKWYELAFEYPSVSAGIVLIPLIFFGNYSPQFFVMFETFDVTMKYRSHFRWSSPNRGRQFL